MAITCTLVGSLVAARALSAQSPARPRADTTRATSARITVRVSSEGRPVDAALVRSGTGPTAVGAQTDARGIATLRLAAGNWRLITSKVGYDSDAVAVSLRADADTLVAVELRAARQSGGERGESGERGERGERTAALSGVVVTATRGQRRIETEPTRVDVLDHEEVEEKTAMVPGNAAMLLSETGGVRVATTSPGLGGANVRIQGLRGRFTQLLSDGLPLYGLTTEGLGLLQVPPIDLRQVELIKGTASALYGPSALGGVVNFVSRRPPVLVEGRPRETRELYLNQTTLDGSDLAFFDARALSPRAGFTLLASANRQRRRDLNDDGWADLPGYQRGVVRPRLFWTGADGSDVFVTTGLTAEDRAGGTVAGGRLPTGLPFAEGRDTRRADVGAVAHRALGGGRVLAIRGSATGEWRQLTFGVDRVRDRRSTVFGEAALTLPFGGAAGGTPTGAATSAGAVQELVLGAAIQRDGYTPRDLPALAYVFTVPALFAQHTWTPTPWFGLTSSARLDHHSEYGTTLSPRVSVVWRPRAAWTARVSGGAGTYAPTPFVEETEEIGFRHVRPLTNLRSERARNASADVGGVLGPLELNAAVYASVIDRAVGVRAVDAVSTAAVGADGASSALIELVNANAPTRTHGAQLFARYRGGEYSVTGSYDYQRATEEDLESPVSGQRRGVPLTPRHSAGLVASWETADDAGLSVEAFYTGRQPLADNPYRGESRPFAMVGALARWRVGKTILFLNGENLGNVRQTSYDPLLRRTPGLGGRWTTDVWAPIDGVVVNAGVRLSF